MKKTLLAFLITAVINLQSNLAAGSDYPALDFLRTSDSFTSSGWFNCGLQPAVSTATGGLQLKVVSVRGAGSCTSSDVLNLTCEKFRNRCSRGSTAFYTCTNGDFVFGERYARGFYYGDMIAPCVPVPDQVAALIEVKFIDADGNRLDYVLPGKTYDLHLHIKNETSETLSGYSARLSTTGSDGITLSQETAEFGDLAARQYGTLVTPVKVTVAADSCSDMFSLKFTITKDQRKRDFTHFFSVGKPVYPAAVLRTSNVALKSDGTTTVTLPAIGNVWPYNATIFKAAFRSRITHASLGEISAVALQSPLASQKITLFRGDGKRNGSQTDSGDLTAKLQGKNGWGDWVLTSQEKEWRQEGVLNSFDLELTPAVFNCAP